KSRADMGQRKVGRYYAYRRAVKMSNAIKKGIKDKSITVNNGIVSSNVENNIVNSYNTLPREFNKSVYNTYSYIFPDGTSVETNNMAYFIQRCSKYFRVPIDRVIFPYQ